MDIREKLVELLIPVLHDYSRAAACMEYLIANGVTVQGNAEWERKEHDRCGVFWFECSECHIKWGYGAVLHMKYCPNCGLIMKPLLPPKGE